jgi:predicted dehydrogenase
MYVPYLKQEEPLKVECQHFIDCIRSGQRPLTAGEDGHNMVQVLEAASLSLKQGGAEVQLGVQTAVHDRVPARLSAATV